MTLKIDGYTYEEIKNAHRVAAEIVALYGDAYLPVFKRLHAELQKFEETNEIKRLALQYASAYAEGDRT